MSPWVVVAATVAIVALSAFFVAVEFAALAAKRHRLEEAAADSRAARAALRGEAYHRSGFYHPYLAWLLGLLGFAGPFYFT